MQSFLVRAFSVSLTLPAVGCVSGGEETETTGDEPLEVTVQVDSGDVLRVVPPLAYGMHASVYDNEIDDPALKEQLDAAGIALLRWPGGGYSDNYHWAMHTMTPWSNGNPGYLADHSDFGSFVGTLDRVDREAMITVNYGSNQNDDGPGEPKEAAAWVAYANGDPDDETVIGEDSTGFDWQTVGYWASLRASEPLDDDDGKNFLRIGRSEPVGIVYWEVGNEVFGNGYYAGNGEGFELDMHVPYDGTERQGHPDLSPSAYGEGVREFISEMKAVDPTIKVGAVLVTPPADYRWAPTYNDDVLRECGELIDFGIIHWYPGDADLTTVTSRTMEEMFEELNASIQEHGGDNADNIEITVTELGPPPGYGDHQASVMGLFAADAYLGFIRYGATNIDWLELHNGTFLDEDSPEPGRAYYGIQFAHDLAAPGEQIVRAEANRNEVVVHAGVRADDSLAVMLINTGQFRTARVLIDTPEASAAGTIRSFSSSDSRVPDSVTGPDPIESVEGVREVSVAPETLVLVEFEAGD